MNNPYITTAGQVAYDAYRARIEHDNCGCRLIPWEQLDHAAKHAWADAAEAVQNPWQQIVALRRKVIELQESR